MKDEFPYDKESILKTADSFVDLILEEQYRFLDIQNNELETLIKDRVFLSYLHLHTNTKCGIIKYLLSKDKMTRNDNDE
jgi:CBS-domain-containing membrane protein